MKKYVKSDTNLTPLDLESLSSEYHHYYNRISNYLTNVDSLMHDMNNDKSLNKLINIDSENETDYELLRKHLFDAHSLLLSASICCKHILSSINNK